jgi:hypothetical protein
MKTISLVCLIGLLFGNLLGFGCSRFPNEADFKDWLRAVYERETGLQADEIFICSWERIPEEVLRVVPDVDGLKVQAVIFSSSNIEDMPEKNSANQTIIHYVYCNYYKISDEWYLHASSWGEGFWKQAPAEWGHLVQDCKVKAEKFRSNVAGDPLGRNGDYNEKNP